MTETHGAGCPELRVALGGYVLGALEPAERASVESHLQDCASCRDEVAGLAGLPGLLGRVSEAEVVAAAAVTDQRLLDRLLARAAVEARRRRRRGILAAAAAAVLLGTGGTAVGLDLAARHSPRAGPVLSVADGRVRAQAQLVRRDWGTSIGLSLSGVTPGEHCQLVAVGRHGGTDVAASWQAAYDGRAKVAGATAISLSELASLRVVTTDGRILATLVNG